MEQDYLSTIILYLTQPNIITIIVFICATLVQLLGIAIIYSKLFPPLDSIIFTSFVNMREALNRLENKEEILKQDSGFNEIVRVILKDIKKDNPSVLCHKERLENVRGLKKKDIVRLTFNGIPRSYPGFQVGYLANRIQVDYKDINNNTRKVFTYEGSRCGSIKVFYYKIEEALENERLSSLFWYAIIIFAIGTSMQLVNIIVNMRIE